MRWRWIGKARQHGVSEGRFKVACIDLPAPLVDLAAEEPQFLASLYSWMRSGAFRFWWDLFQQQCGSQAEASDLCCVESPPPPCKGHLCVVYLSPLRFYCSGQRCSINVHNMGQKPTDSTFASSHLVLFQFYWVTVRQSQARLSRVTAAL